MAGLDPIGVRISGVRRRKRILPLPLWEGVGGEGSVGDGTDQPLPPTPSRKGRGSILFRIRLILTPMGSSPGHDGGGLYPPLTTFCDAPAMPRLPLAASLLFAALLPFRAMATDPGTACVDAAVAAEHNWTLPPNLIHAIGQVESGRFDTTTGQVTPWPWTVNGNGSGSYFASRAEAIAFVRTLQSRGVRLIDVGCFQVDLFYHPAAFASLEQAFDPTANADYAARFLTDLHQRTGSWQAAIADYHSALPLEGETYRRKVMNQWGSTRAIAVATESQIIGGSGRRPPNQDRPNQDRYVVLMSVAARAIPVIGP